VQGVCDKQYGFSVCVNVVTNSCRETNHTSLWQIVIVACNGEACIADNSLNSDRTGDLMRRYIALRPNLEQEKRLFSLSLRQAQTPACPRSAWTSFRNPWRWLHWSATPSAVGLRMRTLARA
jgi:hypothetical protein